MRYSRKTSPNHQVGNFVNIILNGETDGNNGDINGDGYVDVFDLAVIAIHFGETYELDGPAIATAPAIVQLQPQG